MCICIHIIQNPKKNRWYPTNFCLTHHSCGEFPWEFPTFARCCSSKRTTATSAHRNGNSGILVTPKRSPDLVGNPGSVGSYRHKMYILYTYIYIYYLISYIIITHNQTSSNRTHLQQTVVVLRSSMISTAEEWLNTNDWPAKLIDTPIGRDWKDVWSEFSW